MVTPLETYPLCSPNLGTMCKLIVVLYRRQDFTHERFLDYLRDVHGAMADGLCSANAADVEVFK